MAGGGIQYQPLVLAELNPWILLQQTQLCSLSLSLLLHALWYLTNNTTHEIYVFQWLDFMISMSSFKHSCCLLLLTLLHTCWHLQGPLSQKYSVAKMYLCYYPSFSFSSAVLTLLNPVAPAVPVLVSSLILKCLYHKSPIEDRIEAYFPEGFTQWHSTHRITVSSLLS